MIGVSSSSRDFAALAAYLARGRGDDAPDRVAWTVARNLPTNDPDVAATMMHASAARNARVAKPVYHLAISFDPGDHVDRNAMELVADRVLAALGLAGHQSLIISHQDREHPHLHLMINRVHPETGRAWSRWQDQRVVQRVLREEELALGLRRVPGRLATTPQLDALQLPPNDAAAGRSASAVLAASGRQPDDELARSVQAVEHAVAARREELASRIAVEAARSRLGTLDTATHRAAQAMLELRRALATMYRDPDSALHALQHEIRRIGIRDALAQLVRQPEHFGAIHTGQQRWLGILPRGDTGPALRAAPYVAGKARDAFEAEAAALALTSANQVRAAQTHFTRALADVYVNAEEARRVFEGFALVHGAAHALQIVDAEPKRLGAMRAWHHPNAERQAMAGVLVAGRHFLAVEAAARAQKIVVGLAAPDALTKALAAARSDVRNALVAHAGTRVSVRSQGAPAHLDRLVRQAIGRLLPAEVARVSLAWSKPTRALVAKVRRSIRDAVLERDVERS